MNFVSPVRRTGFLGSTLRLSSLFGMRKNPVTGKRVLHNGVDIAIPQGTPIYAVAPGIVKSADASCRSKVNGGNVTLRHTGGALSSYVHMSRIDVRPGQTVERWTRIGLSGGKRGDRCAGRSTGPHLHFIIRPRGEAAANPVQLVNWWPFSLSYKGRNVPVLSREWGGAVSQVRQLPWWVFALGGLSTLVLVVGASRAVGRRRPARALARAS